MTSHKPLSRAKVLVVEDDPILAFYLVGFLSSAGAEIIGPAATVRRAQELAEVKPISCAIIDLHLHDGLVFPLAQELRRKGVSIVIYTGDPTALETIQRDLPHAAAILKPAAVETLISAAAKACELA
jgi:DNA-binding response OmpR family regulator